MTAAGVLCSTGHAEPLTTIVCSVTARAMAVLLMGSDEALATVASG